MTDKVRIAKKDLFAEIDNGEGQKIRQLVAREGQEVPPVLLQYVSEDDVTTERPKTKSTPIVGVGTRSGAERRASVDRGSSEPDHADVRLAAAVVEPQADADVPVAAPASDELVAENAELREQLAEAEERATAAEKEAEEARAAAEADNQEKEAEVKDDAAGSKEGAKAEEGAKSKARAKGEGDKARKSPEAKK